MRTIAITVLASLLIGCQTSSNESDNSPLQNKQSSSKSIYNRYTKQGDRYTLKQDAAPIKAKPISFKDAIPIKEPLSRYGNPTEYKVDGRSYEVMRSTNDYRAIGVASWYGAKFHKQRTSSGEPYDMYIMTAAHKTLPLPTYVKVKNLDNGKEAVVKVNDRGPFHSDRILDLSYAAAVKLGVYPKGTANVEVLALIGPEVKGHYYLQAGAFTSMEYANQLKNKISNLIKSSVNVEHFKDHYVVRIGPFENKQTSEKIKMSLADNGLKGIFSVLI